jgi:hypothetical protein
MIIYHYHPESGEYLGKGEATESPLDLGAYLIPAFATAEEPPKTENNKVAVFEKGKWQIRPDFRGKIFYKVDTQERIEIKEIGIEPDKNMVDQVPEEYEEWDSKSEKWKINLDLLKESKINEVKREAGMKINEQYGFHKQININELQGYTQKDKDKMWNFINSIRDRANTMINEINSMSDKDKILDYESNIKEVRG